MLLLQIHQISVHWWCPFLIWFVCVNFFCAICFAVQDGIGQLRRLHQVPCDRCAFYTGDYRLKCTVNPCAAFTENSINCPDWQPRVTPIRPNPKDRRYIIHRSIAGFLSR